VSLVAFHTGARIEAEERGLSSDLAAFTEPTQVPLDVLTFSDMTTDPDGVPISAPERIAEILSRYPDADPVHRAASRSAPNLVDSHPAPESSSARLAQNGYTRRPEPPRDLEKTPSFQWLRPASIR
jgi:hypothetical protein